MMKRSAGRTALIALLVLAPFGLLPSVAASVLCAQPAVAKDAKQNRVSDWFQRYDQIRHQAQMSPQEKERSTALMAQGVMASFVQSADAAQDKAAANALLNKMVDRYTKASAEMAELPVLPETKKLHQGYSQYFHDARSLFADYLKVQNNLFATDANGNGLVGQLTQRKTDLETLDAANKDLDAKLRAKYGVAPYLY